MIIKLKKQISEHLFYHKRPLLATPFAGKLAGKTRGAFPSAEIAGILFFRSPLRMHNPLLPRQTMVKHQEVKHMERKTDRENQRRERQPQRENDRRDQNLTNCKDR